MKKKNAAKMALLGVFSILFSVGAYPVISKNKLIQKTVTVPIPPQQGPRVSSQTTTDLLPQTNSEERTPEVVAE